jgi:hypothetical protein
MSKGLRIPRVELDIDRLIPSSVGSITQLLFDSIGEFA